jgi:hypothetical protein
LGGLIRGKIVDLDAILLAARGQFDNSRKDIIVHKSLFLKLLCNPIGTIQVYGAEAADDAI